MRRLPFGVGCFCTILITPSACPTLPHPKTLRFFSCRIHGEGGGWELGPWGLGWGWTGQVTGLFWSGILTLCFTRDSDRGSQKGIRIFVDATLSQNDHLSSCCFMNETSRALSRDFKVFPQVPSGFNPPTSPAPRVQRWGGGLQRFPAPLHHEPLWERGGEVRYALPSWKTRIARGTTRICEEHSLPHSCSGHCSPARPSREWTRDQMLQCTRTHARTHAPKTTRLTQFVFPMSLGRGFSVSIPWSIAAPWLAIQPASQPTCGFLRSPIQSSKQALGVTPPALFSDSTYQMLTSPMLTCFSCPATPAIAAMFMTPKPVKQAMTVTYSVDARSLKFGLFALGLGRGEVCLEQ